MTNEEIVIQIQAGRTELLSDLWEAVRRFVAQQANKWAQHWAPYDGADAVNEFAKDLSQAGYLAVEEAARKYNPDMGALFLTYLNYRLKKYFRRTTAEYYGWSLGTFDRAIQVKVDSLERRIQNEGSDNATERGDFIADENDYIAELTEHMFCESLHAKLETMLNRLDPDENRIIRLRFYQNLSYERISAITGWPEALCTSKISSALGKLRDMAAHGELDEYINRRTYSQARVSESVIRNKGISPVERKRICLKRDEMRASMLESLIIRRG
jgi:RNA polymerase sigma factor (sigma-70 family)